MLSRIIKNVVQNVNSCPEYNIVFTSFLSVGRRWSTYTSLILRFTLKCLYQAKESEQSCICVWGFDFASFYKFYMGFCNCSDSVVFFFHFYFCCCHVNKMQISNVVYTVCICNNRHHVCI